MDFEARIEALAARHEALTMNLELLSRDHEDTNRRVVSLLTAIEGLARVAEIHERRLTDLEGGEAK